MLFAEVSDSVQIATLLTGMVSTCFVAYLTYRLNVTASHLQKVDEKVDSVVTQTDGLAKALANTAGKAGFAAGKEAEQSKAKALPDVIRIAVAEGIAEEKKNGGTHEGKPC